MLLDRHVCAAMTANIPPLVMHTVQALTPHTLWFGLCWCAAMTAKIPDNIKEQLLKGIPLGACCSTAPACNAVDRRAPQGRPS